MALFVLGLTLLPCTDHHLHVAVDEVVVYQPTSDSEAHSHLVETCSPFCVCQCCGMGVQLLYPFQLAGPVFQLYKPARNFRFLDFENPVFYGFWQPPKIGFVA